jgi:hypothetical protein
MTANPDEGKQVASGTPAPTDASVAPVQPSTETVPAWAKDMMEQFKTAQSVKDKRFNALQPLLDAMEGLAPEDQEKVKAALRNKALDELVAGKYAPAQPTTQTVAPSAPPANTVDSGKIVSELNLDPNDPQVVMILKQSPADMTVQLAKLAVEKAKLPVPDSSTKPIVQGAPAPVADEAALIAELEKLQKTPTKNPARMKEIEKALNW